MSDEEITAMAFALAKQHGYWGEHPDHAAADWRDEVANEETRQGYWFWVAARIEEHATD